MKQDTIQRTTMEWFDWCDTLDRQEYEPNDWWPTLFECIRDGTSFNNQAQADFLEKAHRNRATRLQKQRLATRPESTGKELFVGPTDTNSEIRTRRLLDELEPRIQEIRTALGMEELFRSPRGVYNRWEQSRNGGANDLGAEFKKRLKKIFLQLNPSLHENFCHVTGTVVSRILTQLMP